MTKLDFNATYQLDDHPGIAWKIIEYRTTRIYDAGLDYEEEVEDPLWVKMHMVGDDQVFLIEVDELRLLNEDEYCPECGQIGCKVYG